MTDVARPMPALTSDPFVSSHVETERQDVLSHIKSPEINLSLWRRSALPDVVNEVSILEASALPDIRSETSPVTFDDDISALMRGKGLDPEDFEHWRRDLRLLADLYFELCEDRAVTLRLETSDQARCPRFHVDRTHLRLLCTYRGQSTEWLSHSQTDRQAQMSGAPNEDIIRFGLPSNFGLFTVGIMKGDAYPGSSGFGLVHRSPPVAGPDRTRVLFCLDC